MLSYTASLGGRVTGHWRLPPSETFAAAFLVRCWGAGGVFFFFQAEDGIRDVAVTGVQTCALPISDQGHALKIVPFGEHLRADENIQRAADKRSERFLVLALGSRGVAVQPRDAGARKFLAQAFFQVLRALAKKIDVFRLALGTVFRDRLNGTAVMTFEAVCPTLLPSGNAATVGFDRSATAPTQH